ncbi:MAG: phosphoserine/homoserine phosphotransferase [Candidatus Omnitrophota bacterium]
MSKILCLDLEGVLAPEIWIEFANKTGLSLLKRTTRDEPDYNKLMRFRLQILRENGFKLADIQKVIATLKPLPGAINFVRKAQAEYQVVILSDTFYEFAQPIMKQLGYPMLLCNFLEVSKTGFITKHRMRQKDGKAKAVRAFKKLGLVVHAAGDSYNDLSMLGEADHGVLFRPPSSIIKSHKQFTVTKTHPELWKQLIAQA